MEVREEPYLSYVFSIGSVISREISTQAQLRNGEKDTMPFSHVLTAVMGCPCITLFLSTFSGFDFVKVFITVNALEKNLETVG